MSKKKELKSAVVKQLLRCAADIPRSKGITTTVVNDENPSLLVECGDFRAFLCVTVDDHVESDLRISPTTDDECEPLPGLFTTFSRRYDNKRIPDLLDAQLQTLRRYLMFYRVIRPLGAFHIKAENGLTLSSYICDNETAPSSICFRIAGYDIALTVFDDGHVIGQYQRDRMFAPIKSLSADLTTLNNGLTNIRKVLRDYMHPVLRAAKDEAEDDLRRLRHALKTL